MKKLSFLFSAACLLAAGIQAQTPVIRWQKTIGGSATDELRTISPTSDGGYIIGGGSNSPLSGEKTDDRRCTNPSKCGNDYWLLKTDDTGGIRWQKTIGCDPTDELRYISQTADGGYIVGGSSASGICGDKTDVLRGGSNSDYWILKLDDTGRIEWQKTIGGSRLDNPAMIEQTTDGGYIVGGTSQSNTSGEKTSDNWGSGPLGTPNDFWILKLDDTGRIEWQQTIGGTASDELKAIHQTADGGYIAGGTSSSGITGNKTEASRGNSDYWVIKLGSTGSIQWQKTIGSDGADVFATIQQTSDGGYIVGGSSISGNISGERDDVRRGIGNDYWILKLDDTGRIEWQKTIGADQANTLSNIEQTPDGGYIVGGTSASDISAEKTEDSWNLTNDYWVLKLNAAGDIQWQKTIGGNGADNLAYVRQSGPHEYILGGSSGSGISGNKTEAGRGGDYDFWMVKLVYDCDTAAAYAADSFCRGVPFTYVLPGGATVSAPGVYRDTFAGVTGCDSIWVTTLSLIQVDTGVTRSGQALAARATGAAYQWIDCATGQGIPGATGAIFTPAASGSYALSVTSGGCSDTSGCFEVIPSGLEQISPSQDAGIRPNPAYDAIYIDRDAVAVVIYNMEGRIVLQQGHGGRTDINRLAPGLYMARITGRDGQLLLEKFVKAGRN